MTNLLRAPKAQAFRPLPPKKKTPKSPSISQNLQNLQTNSPKPLPKKLPHHSPKHLPLSQGCANVVTCCSWRSTRGESLAKLLGSSPILRHLRRAEEWGACFWWSFGWQEKEKKRSCEMFFGKVLVEGML